MEREPHPDHETLCSKGEAASIKAPVAGDFDPAKHLNFSAPAKVTIMKDIGFSEDIGISPVAVSDAFPLFSQEAVEMMRTEVFSDEVWKNCRYSSNIAACQLRGFCPKYANFTYDAWKNPQTLALISKVAGVDLIPCMDFEIGHVNISIKSDAQTAKELADYHAKQEQEAHGATDQPTADDDKSVVGWHTDAYPFVCVLMLSDASKMIGGETALMTASGKTLKVRGPQMGSAVILQGRYIQHRGLEALGSNERITMVTSFRPGCPSLPDDTQLTTVRPVSDLSELYQQFSEYRLEIVEERVRKALKNLRDVKRGQHKTDTKAVKKFIQEQADFLKQTDEELVEEEMVVQGQINAPVEGQMGKETSTQGDKE